MRYTKLILKCLATADICKEILNNMSECILIHFCFFYIIHIFTVPCPAIQGSMDLSPMDPTKRRGQELKEGINTCRKLSPEVVQDLHELYKIDFEMFGYD